MPPGARYVFTPSFVANLNHRLHSNGTADFQGEIEYFSRKCSFSMSGWITSLTALLQINT